MLATTEKIIDADFQNRTFTENDLARLFGGTDARRYGLVNKALKKNELIRLRRGLYVLATKYRTERFSKFMLANQILPYSYVSLESALSYHGWIPEKVTTVFSVTSTHPNKTFTTSLGDFEYYRIPTNPYEFLTGVDRINSSHQSFLVAMPIRALADYVYLRKPHSANLNYLQNSLRIELSSLQTITPSDLNQLKSVYRSYRVLTFLNQLRKDLEKL